MADALHFAGESGMLPWPPRTRSAAAIRIVGSHKEQAHMTARKLLAILGSVMILLSRAAGTWAEAGMPREAFLYSEDIEKGWMMCAM